MSAAPTPPAASHTPGPILIKDDGSSYQLLSRRADGTWTHIASVFGSNFYEGGKPRALADARLWAASPKLLALLKLAGEYVAAKVADDGCPAACDLDQEIREALAEAEGRS